MLRLVIKGRTKLIANATFESSSLLGLCDTFSFARHPQGNRRSSYVDVQTMVKFK